MPASRAAAPRLPGRAIWIDGRLQRGPQATLSLFDRGARDGEGLFETVRVEGGRCHFWSRHLERLVLSAAELGFPVPPSPARLAAGVQELLAEENLSDAVVRITVTRGIPGGRPTRTGCWIEAEPLTGRLWSGTRAGAARVVISRTAFEPGSIGRHKTTSRLAYHLAREEARAAGADEALLATAGGVLLEGAVSNVFVSVRGELLTPALSSGILPGIVRAVVLERCRQLGIAAHEAPLTIADLEHADEVLLTNCVQEVVPLASFGGRAFGAPKLAAKLLAECRAAAEATAGGW
ncbi:MAG: aminotransferase class IV [Candidatus Eiseniibacteriota bacterium]